MYFSNKDVNIFGDILFQINISKSDIDIMRTVFLNNIEGIIPYDAASFYIANNITNIVRPVYKYFSSNDMFDYESRHIKEDVMIPMLCNQKPFLYKFTDYTQNQHTKTLVYKNFMEPRNLHYTQGMNLTWNNSFLGIIVLFRSKETGNFNEKELFLLGQFQRQLSYNTYALINSIFLQDDSPAIVEMINTYGLTKREVDIVKILDYNVTNKEIADRLSISAETVKTHLKSIFRKLNLENRYQIYEILRSGESRLRL